MLSSDVLVSGVWYPSTSEGFVSDAPSGGSGDETCEQEVSQSRRK